MKLALRASVDLRTVFPLKASSKACIAKVATCDGPDDGLKSRRSREFDTFALYDNKSLRDLLRVCLRFRHVVEGSVYEAYGVCGVGGGLWQRLG